MNSMLATLTAKGHFADRDKNQVWNVLGSIKATPEQAKDLLNFRAVGQQSFEQLVKTFLKEVSTNALNLNTFTTSILQKK